MNKTISLSIFTLLILAAGMLSAFDLKRAKPSANELTYQYSQSEMEALKVLPKSQAQFDTKQLELLNREVDYLINSSDLSAIEQTILPAYIANAQKDFAWLSYLTTGQTSGDLTPITLWTMQLFIPDAILPSASEKNFDVYSSSIASLVISKTVMRLNEERKQIADYPIKKAHNIWTPTSEGYRGLNYGSAKTWYLASSDEYLADQPVDSEEFWAKECDDIKKEQDKLTNEKVHAVFEWAGLTSLDAGSWEQILNKYMAKNHYPVMTQLNIRAHFLSALADSNAAAFNSKYTFWVMRPSQRDDEVEPLVIIPNHPSYPSAHSTISATAAMLLSDYFPQDKEQWWLLAEEAGMSRIWGGIHYPADHKAGLKLGKQVGEAALERSNQQQSGHNR